MNYERLRSISEAKVISDATVSKEHGWYNFGSIF
jgi:hypothetical protein